MNLTLLVDQSLITTLSIKIKKLGLGWVTDEELDKIISITDFGYVPYSFDKNFQNFTQTSFPNKLTTLSKKYVPVIAHGPKNSSLNKFVDHYKIGITINELLVKNLNEQMLLLKQNIENVYQNMSKINHTIFDNKLIIKNITKHLMNKIYANIKLNSFVSQALFILNISFRFLLTPLIITTYSDEITGLYFLVFNISSYFMFFDFGFGRTLTYELIENNNIKRKEELFDAQFYYIFFF